jgi:DnaJ-domain-containing protein 1
MNRSVQRFWKVGHHGLKSWNGFRRLEVSAPSAFHCFLALSSLPPRKRAVARPTATFPRLLVSIPRVYHRHEELLFSSYAESQATPGKSLNAFEILSVSANQLDDFLLSSRLENTDDPGERKIQRALKESYRQLMIRYHPDKQQQESAPSADQVASTVTHAYQTLRHIHSRALHRLDLWHAATSTPTNPENTNSTEIVGTEFLMEIMEIRSEIDDCVSFLRGGDTADCSFAVQRLQQLSLENRTHTFQANRSLSQAWKQLAQSGDRGRPNAEDEVVMEIEKLTAQLQYYHRIDETIRQHVDLDNDNDA